MSALAPVAGRPWKRPPLFIHSRFWRIAIYGGVLAYLVLAVGTLDINWTRVSEGLERSSRVLSGFFQPDFTSRWRDI